MRRRDAILLGVCLELATLILAGLVIYACVGAVPEPAADATPTPAHGPTAVTEPTETRAPAVTVEMIPTDKPAEGPVQRG